MDVRPASIYTRFLYYFLLTIFQNAWVNTLWLLLLLTLSRLSSSSSMLLLKTVEHFPSYWLQSCAIIKKCWRTEGFKIAQMKAYHDHFKSIQTISAVNIPVWNYRGRTFRQQNTPWRRLSTGMLYTLTDVSEVFFASIIKSLTKRQLCLPDYTAQHPKRQPSHIRRRENLQCHPTHILRNSINFKCISQELMCKWIRRDLDLLTYPGRWCSDDNMITRWYLLLSKVILSVGISDSSEPQVP
jgi:hypothetical protein